MAAESGSLQRGVPAREQVVSDMRGIVAEQLGMPRETIEERHDLERDLGADSLDLVEINMEVEEHFGLTVPDEVYEQIRTVGQVVDQVLALLSADEPG